jgi:hypothetical protein
MQEFLEKEEVIASGVCYGTSDRETLSTKERFLEKKTLGRVSSNCGVLKGSVVNMTWFELPNGERYGKFFADYPEGGRAVEGQFVNGNVGGKYTVFYGGKVRRETEFSEGLRHGQSVKWNERGLIERITTYIKGKKFEDYSFDQMTVWELYTNKPSGFMISKTYHLEGSQDENMLLACYRYGTKTSSVRYWIPFVGEIKEENYFYVRVETNGIQSAFF